MKAEELKDNIEKIRISQRQIAKDLNISAIDLNRMVNDWIEIPDPLAIKLKEYLEMKRKQLLKSLID